MSEKSGNASQGKVVNTERVTQGRQPMAITPIPAGLRAGVQTMTDAPPSSEERGRQPVPTTPAPAQPAQSPAGPGSPSPADTVPKK